MKDEIRRSIVQRKQNRDFWLKRFEHHHGSCKECQTGPLGEEGCPTGSRIVYNLRMGRNPVLYDKEIEGRP